MAPSAKSDAEHDELLQLCRQRLDAFREQRGEEVICLLIQKLAASATAAASARRSAARSRSGFTDAPGAAASAAGQAVAWQTPHQRVLEVHPIVPRDHGGTGDFSSLQALCIRCKAGKRDGCLPTQEAAPICVACRPDTPCARRAVCSAGWRGCGRVLVGNELVLCIADGFPVTHGHSLVVPQSHGVDGLVLHQSEWN